MSRLGYAEPDAEEAAFRAREGTTAPNLQLVVANASEVARHQLELVRSAAEGMSPRIKELLILCHGRLSGNAYCWGHHVPPALAAGLTEAQVRGVREGDYSLLEPDERVLLDYVEAVEARAVTDELWTSVSAGRSPEELVKLTMLIGCYSMINRVQAAFAVPQDEGFGGFETP
jgi:alkylhydroperoxidase family enzyme